MSLSTIPVSTLDLVEERVGGGDGDPDVGVHAPDDGLELGVDIRGVARVAWAGEVSLVTGRGVLPSAVSSSVLVSPWVPSSSMLSVVRMETGENSAFPVPASCTPCSTIDIVRFQMDSEALQHERT